MARFKIVRLNKMTCGTRRGLVDMDVKIQDIKPDVYLLPGTNLCSEPNDNFPEPYYAGGIATETNTNYKYLRTDAIYDYYKTSGNKQQLAQEPPNAESISLILNEDQLSIDPQTISNDLSSSDAIQLTPEFWVLSAYKKQEVDQYNNARSSFRVVYEFELDTEANAKACLSSSTTQYLPLNDLLDLCVKSMFKKSVENRAIPGNLLLDNYHMTYEKNVDQWFVFEKNPVDFCQHYNDAFVMSNTTTMQPYRMQSNIYRQIQSTAIQDPHKFELVQDQIETVMYKRPQDYNNAKDSPCSSYSEYVASRGGSLGTEELIDVFSPAKVVKNIQYNYIVDIEQNNNPSRQFDNPTIYDNGDIYGSFFIGKNMYNALYSMKMNSLDKLLDCRTYAGIQSMGSKIILKYYDDSDYDVGDNKDGTSYAKQLSSSSSQSGKYPYQKIETFDPIQFGNGTMHKSNLFSLKIYSTGLDDKNIGTYDDKTKKLAENLKKDISNAMRTLAESIAPANTQLFATYFM